MYPGSVVIELTVRAVRERDAQAAVDVIRESISTLCEADHRSDPDTLAQWLANKTANRFRTWIARPDRYTVVAEFDGRLCGVGMLGSAGEVYLRYVHPNYTRLGVGRSLLGAMEARARALGLDRLYLNATSSAMAFYEAMGFRRAGPSRTGFGVTRTNPCDKRLGHHC